MTGTACKRCLPSFAASTGLIELLLANTTATGTVPSWIWTLPRLSTLDLSNNSYTSLGLPSTFPTGMQYMHVNLFNNSIGGTFPPALCELPFKSASVFVRANKFGCVPPCFSYPLSDRGTGVYKHCYDPVQVRGG